MKGREGLKLHTLAIVVEKCLCYVFGCVCRSWLLCSVMSGINTTARCLSVLTGSFSETSTMQWQVAPTAITVGVCNPWSVAVRTQDLGSKRREFDSRLGRYQVVSTWIGDCLQTGKPFWYITNTKVNSAFHHSRVCLLYTSPSPRD